MLSSPFVHKISPLLDAPVLVLVAMGARDSVLLHCAHDSAPLHNEEKEEITSNLFNMSGKEIYFGKE